MSDPQVVWLDDDGRTWKIRLTTDKEIPDDTPAIVMTPEYRAELRKLVEGGPRKHYECEDCWYSCPKADCCDERRKGDKCNCGADKYNALAAAIERMLEATDG